MSRFLTVCGMAILLAACSSKPPRQQSYEEIVKDHQSMTNGSNSPELLEKTRQNDAASWDDYRNMGKSGGDYDRAEQAVKVGTADAEFLDRHFEEYKKLREEARAGGWLNSYLYQRRVEELCQVVGDRVQSQGNEAALQSAPDPPDPR